MGIIQQDMFDGKVCAKCQTWKSSSAFGKNRSRKDGLQAYCTECRKVYDREKNKAYYHRNIEKSREESRQHYYQYKDRIAETNRKRVKEWKRNNPGKVRAGYFRNATAAHERGRKWYLQNKERARAYRSHYKKVKSTYINSVNHARRARQRLVGGKYTAEQWQQLCSWFGDTCLACGQRGKLTVDHVIPLDPGPNTIDNLQPLCLSCNSAKGRKTIDYRDPDRLAAFLEHIQCHSESIKTYPPLLPDTP